ncbi:MAG TPA: hypothetical protein VJ160_05810 [Anaerolineales bacterium]|nr:hypothetical protein [Anaerolineales bacterium]
MKATSFDRLAAMCAYLAALGGILYGFSFVILYVGGRSPTLGLGLSSITLQVGGLLTSVILVAIYHRVHEVSPPLALWALAVGVFGALGSTVHAAYDLANVIHPPASDVFGAAAYPNQVDPRGLLTFAFAGLSLLVFAWLIRHSTTLPRGLGTLGYLLGVLLIVIYLGRLIILDPTNIVVRLALLAGVVANTIWYVWLGGALRKGPAA